MTKRIERRDEQGSIILTVLVTLVATALVVTMLTFTASGLRSTRRTGDSANALQLADAGINEAVKNAGSFTAATTFPITRTVPGSGTYEYSATKDPSLPVWHIVATGTDNEGMKRRVRADAIQRDFSSYALFVRSNLSFSAGVLVDSYVDGSSAANMCTGKGVVGTNDALSMNQGGNGLGNGVTNCRDASFPYPFDGCISYADVNPPDFPADANCPPPPYRSKETPAFVPDSVFPPAGDPIDQPGGECNASNPIPAGTHYWKKVTLRDGCKILGPAKVYTSGNVEIGNSTGNAGDVNAPPASCPNGGPSGWYCSGWPGKLQIFVISDAVPTPTITMYNHLRFWGVLMAPTAELTTGSGSPQIEMWGSFTTAKATTSAQFALHYDEALAQPFSGAYRIRNWVEVPVS